MEDDSLRTNEAHHMSTPTNSNTNADAGIDLQSMATARVKSEDASMYISNKFHLATTVCPDFDFWEKTTNPPPASIATSGQASNRLVHRNG
jgi:hypothetical protein